MVQSKSVYAPQHEVANRLYLASFADAVIFAGDEVADSLVAMLQAALNVIGLPAPLGPHVLSPALYVCQPRLHTSHTMSISGAPDTQTYKRM